MTERQTGAVTLPAEGYVRLRTILAVFPVSSSTWWRGCKSGIYPAPKKLGPRTTVWNVADIRKLIESTSTESTSS